MRVGGRAAPARASAAAAHSRRATQGARISRAQMPSSLPEVLPQLVSFDLDATLW
jgi:hypothetical protein